MTTTARSRLLLLGALALGACAPELESQSKIRSLRVLAVQKDAPYARAGATVTLRMLLTDGSEEAPRPLQVTWLAGCENPAGDLYAGCFQSLAGAGGATELQTGTGLSFSYQLSPDIISRRPRAADPRQMPYGLSYVFFAACAGEVRILPPEAGGGFPIACYGPGGERLGPEDFVAGYTAVYAYDELENANPVVTGFTFDGRPAPPECVDAECVALPGGDAGADAGAEPPRATDPCDPPGPLCVRTCPRKGPCDPHLLSVEVTRTSAEPDEAASARSGANLLEQMWIDYYVEDGSIGTDVKLLNDATRGFNDDHGTKLTPPSEPGPFRVWAVVHDNRGGVGWARLGLRAR